MNLGCFNFFIGSPDLIGTLSYVTLSLLSVPSMYYFKQTSLKKYDKWLNGSVGGLLALLIVGLQLSGLRAYFETVTAVHMVNFLVAITIMGLLVYESVKCQNKEALRAIKVLSFFLLFGAIEFIYFLVGQFKYTSYFLITGIIVIAVIVLVDYLKALGPIIKYAVKPERLKNWHIQTILLAQTTGCLLNNGWNLN